MIDLGNWADLSGVEASVWKNQTRFDYDKWKTVKTELKLMSVNWGEDYENVINWKSNSERDTWFNAKEGHVYPWETAWNFKSLERWQPGLGRHAGSIIVNVPYEEAMDFNYLYVVMGEQPVPGGEIERREHFFYFISSLNKNSPNATELFLTLDSWTTFFPSVSVDAINLHQGHYPLALTTADEYLANPLGNHRGLLTPEPGFDSVKPRVSAQKFISFQKSQPRVCIAMTADLSKPNELWLDTTNVGDIKTPGAVSAPVGNYYDKAIANNSTTSLGHGGLTPLPAVGDNLVNGGVLSMNVFSLSTTTYGAFIAYLRDRFPQVLKTIKAVYLLDSSIIDEGPAFQFYSHTVRPVVQQNSAKMIETLKLSKDLFGFEPKYADLAKLYTEQFSLLEISNLNGQKTTVAIEEIAEDLEFYSRALIAFPYLKLESFINGIGGKEKMNYAVRPWNDQNAELFKSSWEDFRFELSIPTFGIFAESREIDGVLAQINRWRHLKNAKVAKAISELETATNLTNRGNLLSTRVGNEISRINLDFTNRSEEIIRNYSNEMRSIASEENSSLQGIGKNFQNTSADIYRTYQNAAAMLNNSYSLAMESAGIEYGNSMTLISADWTSTQASVQLTNHRESWGAIYQKNINENSNLLENSMVPSYERAGNFAAFYKMYQNLETNVYRNQELASYNYNIDLNEMHALAYLGLATSAGQAIGGSFNAASAISGGVSTVINALQVGAVFDWRKSSMDYRWAGNYRGGEFIGVIPNYDGSVTTFPSLYSALQTQYDTERLTMSTENTRYNYILDRTSSVRYGITNTNIAIDYQRAKEFAELTVNVGQDNNNRTRTSREAVARNEFQLTQRLAGWTRDTAQGIANRDQSVSTSISTRTRDVDTAVTNYSIGNSRTNATNSRDVENIINSRIRSVSLSINQASNVTERAVINLDYSTAMTNITAEYNSRIADLSAAYNAMLFGDPHQFGEQTGSAWVDAWGQRGIDIRVRTISKDVERQVGDQFLRFGYTTGSLWIDEVDLEIMSKFSFWRGDSVWVKGDRINETNKQIIRDIFKKGVTIWMNPDEVLSDINTNLRRIS